MVATTLADLGPFNVSNSLTVSGLSAGGFMAVQMHISHSSIIQGAAIFAGGPFYCAKDSLVTATNVCMYGLMGGPNVQQLIDLTLQDEKAGSIDETKNLADDNVYIFSGAADSVVATGTVKALEDYYNYFVLTDAAETDANNNSSSSAQLKQQQLESVGSIVTEYDLPAQHCMPSVDYGEDCGRLKSPYIGNCDFDGAQVALSTMQLIDSSSKKGEYLAQNLFTFAQESYLPQGWDLKPASLADTGYIYIPTACQSQQEPQQEQCALHVSFHGCSQTYGDIGDVWAVHNGLNEWAESNNIIVLYPYAAANPLLSNPNGCFDWWGYTTKEYGTKDGVQVQWVKSMIDDIRATN